MTLNDIEKIDGSAQYIAQYYHRGKWDYRIRILFRDGSGRKFVGEKAFRSKAQLMHDWHNNRYKFYEMEFEEVK